MKLDWLWWLLILAALLVSPARGAVPADLSLLRDAICEKESRGSLRQADAIGDSGESRGGCQVSIGTADWIIHYAVARGHVGPYMLALRAQPAVLTAVLHVDSVNRALALAYLERIAGIKRTRDPRRLAYWYNAGHNSRFGAKPGAAAYAREVWIMLQGPPLAALAKIRAAGHERSKEAQDDEERNDAP